MIAAWMLFATAVGLLVGVAALGAEPLLAARHALGRPAAALHDSSLALPLARASGYVIRAAASGVPGSLDTLLPARGPSRRRCSSFASGRHVGDSSALGGVGARPH